MGKPGTKKNSEKEKKRNNSVPAPEGRRGFPSQSPPSSGGVRKRFEPKKKRATGSISRLGDRLHCCDQSWSLRRLPVHGPTGDSNQIDSSGEGCRCAVKKKRSSSNQRSQMEINDVHSVGIPRWHTDDSPPTQNNNKANVCTKHGNVSFSLAMLAKQLYTDLFCRAKGCT